MSQTEEPKYKILKPRQSILKAYLREPISETELASFRTAMQTMLGRIDSSQHEEFNKNLVIDFFNQSLYKGNKYMVNTRDRADLAIYSESGQPAVLFEFKGPGRPDMVSKENLKEKALYELILYYIREEEKYHNTDIKHLIITNCWEYFIFDKKDFYQLFASNKQFVQRVLSSDNGSSKDGNDFIYNKIIKPYVENIENKLKFTYLNLHDFTGKIKESNIVENKDFLAAYKLLSPAHLLKLPFSSDHNTLNTGFYQELLYIMGVEEVVEDRVHKIKQLRKDDYQPYSLVEQVYSKLEDYSKITDDAQRFETALGLVLTWINRILFLKLLESQQESFNNNEEVRFLNTRHIKDYDVLNDLFFKVLAKPVKERSSEMMEQFPTVPYLNSSLFEMSQLEEEYFPISGIRMGEMDVFAKTVLRDGRGRKISGRKQTLNYLFEFLDAYDFGSERNTDKGLVRHESKTLINASVLGLIFEKINGYKDGSFFTPGYITQYICQETLRKAVVDKFNKKKGWNCSDFEDLKEHVDYGKREVRTEANEIINSLKICDPAVGSGHFLVSALNELIAIKSELGVLQDRQPQPQRIMDYEVRVELDELVITNEDGESYKYDPSSTTSQRIQETLFEEKRTIIENCLFGVDLNPKSVEICRLRLWIELLKNAYYYKDETGARQLQTLPNIDINIKSGDSLLHRFDLQESIYQVLRSTGITITQYRNAVAEYKNAHNKEVKRHLTELIERIKTILKSEIKQRDPKLTKIQSQLHDLQTQELFGTEWTAKELAKKHKKEKELSKKIKALETYIAERESNKMYLNAFEWRIEFPEVLDNKGNFTGFDCIIGNPPYGVSITGPYRAAIVEGLDKVPDYEIYYYFIQIASQLLMENGLLSYIIPNTYLFNAYANNYRTNILNNWNIIEILDCTKFPIFESAVVRNTINIWQKGAVKNGVVGYRNTANASSFEDLITTPTEHITKPDLLDMNQNWGLAFYLPQTHIKIINKIGSCKNTIQSFFPDISQGLIAYDKYRGQSAEIIRTRAYHYSAYKEGLKQWLWGEDVKRYSVKWNGKEYIDYCEGIANPRQPKFFIGKRILVREITNPSIFAALTDDELYNDPSIIIIKDNLAYSLDIVLGILNSKLATFYHFNHSPKATKGIFPKILVQDIKDFPLPEIPNAEKSHMESLVTTILATKRENPQADTTSYEQEIDKTVFHLYGLTYDEVLIVDPNPPFTREEYEGKLN